MAEKLTKFDFTKPSEITSTEKMPYPWAQWLDGDIWQLTAGEDFHTHPLMMERIIRTRATSRKAHVRLRHRPLHEGNGDPFGIIVMQCTEVNGVPLVGPNQAKKNEQASKRQAKKASAEAEAQELVASINGSKPAKNGAKPRPSKVAASKRPVKAAVVTVPSKRPVKRAALVGAAV